MRAFLRRFRFLSDRTGGYNADGRMMGLGLATAMRKHRSADGVERHLRRWTSEERVDVRK
ncbi:hypothetical protein [Streptosporangium lutulentum]|uniref:Uncharacterized protein n=1 Tax=Streptosporangium lutulentum TaxID=1461250 RepID=A0ABT9QFP0_9ACTN|nr:hypothetical protein [Streptosporangium lutulentum]MDP9845595.1 hypothetical protein [Streptosporangium lutulentum]